MAKKTVILFGGTFDPIHFGHTAVANESLEYLHAESLIFIPAKRSPLKSFFPKASDQHRCAMISLAIAGDDRFQVSDYELQKAGASYTLETVEHFQDRLGRDVSIHWLVGADSIDELPHWHKTAELIDICNLSVMYRAGYEKPDFTKFTDIWGAQRIEKLQKNIIETSLVDISSTEIRKRLADAGDVSGQVCKPVADYIAEHQLYI